MNKNFNNPDVCLMSIALSYSKKTGSIVTIKYGDVFINFKDINLLIKLESGLDDFSVIWVESFEDYWQILIPYSKLSKVEEVYTLFNLLLNTSYIAQDINPIISLPFNYFRKFTESKLLQLDSFFTPAYSDKTTRYKLKIDRVGKHIFEIFINKTVQKYQVGLVVRSGIGNEDL